MAFGLYEFQIYILYPILITMIIFLGVRVLQRKRANINLVFSLFFLITGVSLIFNLIYMINDGTTYLIPDAQYVWWNNAINVAVSCSWIFLYCFVMIVKKSEVEFTPKKQLAHIALYVALMCVLFVIPDGVQPTTYDLTAGVSRRPLWSAVYALYGIALVSVVAIASIVQTIIVYRNFEDQTVKKKFLYIIAGLVLLYIMHTGNYVANAEFFGPGYRDIQTYVTILIIPSVILLYLGMGKKNQ